MMVQIIEKKPVFIRFLERLFVGGGILVGIIYLMTLLYIGYLIWRD